MFEDKVGLVERARSAVRAAQRVPSSELLRGLLPKNPIDRTPILTLKIDDGPIIEAAKPEVEQHILDKVPADKLEKFLEKVESASLGERVIDVTPSGAPIFGRSD